MKNAKDEYRRLVAELTHYRNHSAAANDREEVEAAERELGLARQALMAVGQNGTPESFRRAMGA